jgi:hypothetical protein
LRGSGGWCVRRRAGTGGIGVCIRRRTGRSVVVGLGVVGRPCRVTSVDVQLSLLDEPAAAEPADDEDDGSLGWWIRHGCPALPPPLEEAA